MSDASPHDDADRALLVEGGDAALAELFDRCRDRLRNMVRVRLDRRVAARVAPSDIIQEAYVEAQQRLPEYQRGSKMSPYVWIRFLTMQQLTTIHRRHLAAKQRNARRELSRLANSDPQASSLCLAAAILATDPSPSQAVALDEQRQQLSRALEKMAPTDREVLALKHFEQMNNHEVAEVLQISLAAASQRYYRALKKIARIINELFDDDLNR